MNMTYIVYAEVDIDPQKRTQIKRKIQIYRKANWDKIEDETRKTLAEMKDIEDTSEVNSLWDTFKSSLLTAFDHFVPHQISSPQDRPTWITPEA